MRSRLPLRAQQRVRVLAGDAGFQHLPQRLRPGGVGCRKHCGDHLLGGQAVRFARGPAGEGFGGRVLVQHTAAGVDHHHGVLDPMQKPL
jgi:hypothetical protein